MYKIENLNPKKLGIVLIDFQKGYCDPASDCAVKLGWDMGEADDICLALVPFLSEVRELLPASNILWTRMEEHPSTIAPHLRRSDDKLCAEEALCVRGTEGHKYHIIHPQSGEVEFLKFHASAFSNPLFYEYIKQHGITQLAFAGVIGSRCVNASIISASDRGIACIALMDFIGGPAHFRNEMEVHFKVTNSLYSLPLSGAEFLAEVRKRK